MKAPAGYMRKPALRGFVAPQLAISVLEATLARLGPAARASLEQAALIARIPDPGEALREDRAQRLHQSLRRLYPAEAAGILTEAGRATADALLATQQSPRAQAMLTGAPWTISAWLLGRWARQHSWTFAGSAQFVADGPLEWQLADNPLTRGEAAGQPICDYHCALFERMFRRLVNPDLICREVECCAMGAAACRFVIALE